MSRTRTTTSSSAASGAGIGLGGVIAALLSWSHSPDILWTIVHALFGWFYVIFYLFGGR